MVKTHGFPVKIFQWKPMAFGDPRVPDRRLSFFPRRDELPFLDTWPENAASHKKKHTIFHRENHSYP